MTANAVHMSTMQRMALIGQARAAIRANPRNVEALVALAGLLAAEKDYEAAIAHLQKALAVRKKDAGILRRLVSAANDANDLQLARKYARKLVEIEPRLALNHKSLGLVVEHLGNPGLALESYMRADRLEPENAETLHDIGRCLSMIGEHERAIEYFRKSLAADPHFGLALYAYSQSWKFAPAEVDAFIRNATEATKAPAVLADPPVHANLHYAMGKALDDVSRHEEAFEHFRRANELRRPESEENEHLSFVNVTDAFTREFLNTRRAMGLETDRPVFILGLPRSGTTLTESLCGAHSLITAGDEQTYMPQHIQSLGRDSNAPGAFKRNLEALSSAQIRQIGERYLAQCAPVAGTTPHFTDKLPHNFLNIGFIALLFPNAKIIHCRRHPLDNCFSLYSNSMSKFHNRYKSDLARLGLYYRQYAQLMDHWNAVLPGRIHEVFYEDMVANTELNARGLIAYLGLDWEDGVMDRSGSQRSVRTLSGWQVRQPIYQTSKGKWRRYESHLGPLIEAIGPYVARYERELEALSQEEGAS